MASPQAVGVAVRTNIIGSLVPLIALASSASADSGDREILGDDGGWKLEDVELRTMYLDQDGRGFQSVEDGTPGKETMVIVQPSLLINARQNERVSHALTLPLDAITAASPDAVDATSSAASVYFMAPPSTWPGLARR